MRLKKTFGLFLAAFVSGCAAFAPAPLPLPPETAKLKPSSIRAQAVVELKKPVPLSGKAVIIAKSPGSFRIEVLGPFSHTLALLVSDGESLYMFSRGQSSRFGWDDPELPYPFKAEEVVSFLLGAGPVNGGGAEGQIVSTDAEGHITKITRIKDGSAVFTASLSDYRIAGGAHIPFNISIENGKEGLSIRYSSVEINPEINSDFFNTDGLP